MNGTLVTGPRANATRFLAFNIPFLIALFAIAYVPGVLRPLLVGWILFLAPGLALTDRRSRNALDILFGTFVRSIGTVIVCWVLLALLPGTTSRPAFLLAIGAIMNAALLNGSRAGWYPPIGWRSPFGKALTVLGLAVFCQSYVGAAYRIPALEDQDMEVQGTAYGLVNELSPTMVTNRGTTHFFAHPPLLHVWIGLSMLVTDDLEPLRFYHEAAVAGRGEDRERLDARFRDTYRRFEREPVLLATRTPNVVLSVLMAICLALVIRRLTDSDVASIGGAVLYATLPEVYVRSAYGGYMVATNVWALFATWSYLESARLFDGAIPSDRRSWRSVRAAFLASLLGAWANQKSVITGVAAAIHGGTVALVDMIQETERRFWDNWYFRGGLAVAGGFVIGWGLFAAYGLLIDRAEFIADHLRTHLIDRLRLDTVYLVKPEGSKDKYPSIGAMWIQFAAHTGWLVTAAGVLGIGRAFRRLRDAEGYLLCWFLLGAIAFSVVDWRQTKHLALIVPPLVMLIAVFWAASRGPVRVLLSIALGAGVLWNLWRIGQLMIDFTYLVPYRMW